MQNSSFDPKFFKIGPAMHNTLPETHINSIDHMHVKINTNTSRFMANGTKIIQT